MQIKGLLSIAMEAVENQIKRKSAIGQTKLLFACFFLYNGT
ncbi:hypothetical protein B835_979 [Enterococcus mundtii 3F]|nr:hypothetical protein [Enterococcus mundtii 3F]